MPTAAPRVPELSRTTASSAGERKIHLKTRTVIPARRQSAGTTGTKLVFEPFFLLCAGHLGSDRSRFCSPPGFRSSWASRASCTRVQPTVLPPSRPRPSVTRKQPRLTITTRRPHRIRRRMTRRLVTVTTTAPVSAVAPATLPLPQLRSLSRRSSSHPTRRNRHDPPLCWRQVARRHSPVRFKQVLRERNASTPRA
jgi:hypothetical protein